MAKKEWAIHVVADDGVATFGSGSKKGVEKMREEILDQGGALMVSSVTPLTPGATYWVVHVRMKDGDMKSFGFEQRPEAKKFHEVIIREKVKGIDCVSFASKGDLE